MSELPLGASGSRHERGLGHPALLRLGFRPFYLLASIFAAASIALWTAQYLGWLHAPYLAGPLWHAHEMVFGFTLAVIGGFLLTAVPNWTGQSTPTGPTLALLVVVWLAGRVLVLTPFGWAAAAVNAAFPLAVAAGIAPALARSANRRNYFFLALLLVFAGTSLAVHLPQLGVVDLPAWLGIRIALDVVLLVITVIAGRVIPMFTNNGVPGAGARRVLLLERAVIGATLVVLGTDALQLGGPVLIALLAVAAALHAARAALWMPWKTLKVPLVWILHAGYAWLPLYLALRALAEAGWIAPALATHALTVGAIGGMTLAMMTRTARGHTGRPLRADGFEVACFALVQAAAFARVLGPWIAPGRHGACILASGALWSSAYALYAVRYWPVLTRPRLDGKPG